MNDEKHDGQPINDVDRVIYDYLDEMLHDPAAEASVAQVSPLPNVVPDNVTHFDVSKKKRIPSPLPSAFEAIEPTSKEPSSKESAPKSSPSSKSSSNSKRENVESKPYSLVDRPALLSESVLRVAEPPVEEVLEKKIESKSPAPTPALTPEPVTEQPADPEESGEALEGMSVEHANPWCDNGRPAWAQSRFECLIFLVNGLKLAVPLVTLGSIHQIDRKFNALPGQYDWFLGILQTASAGNIKVLDTGLCVMPERHDPSSRESLAYVITIHGYSWGLACHEVQQSITLEPDQVKWRTQRGKRSWLAGTVVDHMCSLVDTDGFQEIIQKAEQSQ